MSAKPVIILMNEADLPMEVLGKDNEAGLGALRTEQGLLPLEAVNLEATLSGLTGELSLTQTFINTHNVALEATYIFPLPERGAVQRFRMHIGERIIEGDLKERAAARREYRQAIEQGHQAAITEEERPGVFTIRVGNIPPKERVKVELEIAQPLPVMSGEVLFRFPLVVAPRYIPGTALHRVPVGTGTHPDTDAVPDASRITPPVLLPGFPNPVALGIRVHFPCSSLRPSSIHSSLHAVTETAQDDGLCLSINPGERLNRDFILRYRLSSDSIQTSAVVHPDQDGIGGTFAITLLPPATMKETRKPRDVVLLLDHSGSMQGWKMVTARRACARIIEQLNDEDRFQVIAFDSSMIMPPGFGEWLQPASFTNRSTALAFLETVKAEGGTEILPALSRSLHLLLHSMETSQERSLVLITDGEVGNESQILRQLSSQLKQVRIHALGIDRAVNAGFLQQLADVSGGSSFLVETEQLLETVIDQIQRRLGTPVLQNLKLEANGIIIGEETLTPARLPDLFADAPLTLRGRYQGNGPATFTLKAELAGKPWSTFVAGEKQSLRALSTLWARHRLRDLEDQYAMTPIERLEKQIVRISLDHQVLCKFTAYLAVDRSRVANPSGQLHQVTQPVEMVDGWETLSDFDAEMSGVPPTLNACIRLTPRTFKDAPVLASAPSKAESLMRKARSFFTLKQPAPSALSLEQFSDMLKRCLEEIRQTQPVVTKIQFKRIVHDIEQLLDETTRLPVPSLGWSEVRHHLNDLKSLGTKTIAVTHPIWQALVAALERCCQSLHPVEEFWKG
jgi:Ca-activated chloride channel homolog